MNPIDPTLTPFFAPDGVAILGASHDPTKLGYGLSRNLIQSGYRGSIHFVNLKGGVLMGHPVYRSLDEVPDPLDLAVLLIPAQAVPQALLDCARRGVAAAIIASGGFRETGPDGAALEQQCLQLARQHGIRLLGPNCIGLLDTHLPLDTTFLSPPGPTPGDVAFISHSGAICAAVIDWARGQGFGLSRLVSLGNQVDVNETDMLAPVAADPYTRVVTLYLEGVSDGRRFVDQASQVTRAKPVVALKVGRFSSGQRAVASHTGALAGEESAFNAGFRRAGVIRAETTEELFDWARALAWCPLPKGRSVAVLTNSGGPGVTAADALESHGLRLANLNPDTHAALQSLLVSAASLQNPVDMLAAASPQQYANCLRILLADPQVDSAMVILPPPPMHTAGGIAKAIIPVIYTAEKPVVVALMGERLIQEAVEYFRAAHVPDYRFPERAAVALAVLAQRYEYLASTVSEAPTSPALSGLQQVGARQILAAQTPGGFLPAEDVFLLLETYGIPCLQTMLATDPSEAGQRALELGFPVAMKLASPDIQHKSDVGGVLLNLADVDQVSRGYLSITENARRAHPQAHIQGVHLQRMVPDGQEVIVGALQDAQFGALVMFGSGGVEVEGLKDVQFALAPLSQAEAESLLENTWAGQKLRGYRNFPPADRAAVLEVILRLAQLAADFPQLAEIEINPLRVLESGALAVDARARLAA
ncbi:MAG TPA: acetate--CoA ligase family protein [Anaerolineales bacterium]|nr:acetate--CoA ligase family protein [Anaerolineales bacterium]